MSSTIDNPAAGEPVDRDRDHRRGVRRGLAAGRRRAPDPATSRPARPLRRARPFRFNLATSHGRRTVRAPRGDRYLFTAVLPDDSLAIDDAPSVGGRRRGHGGAFLDTQAQEWTWGESDADAPGLRGRRSTSRTEGKYSDGVVQAEKIYYAGHHVRRLGDDFVNAPIMAGNDEQYAATMALLANRIGVPARVVMGAVVPESGVVHGLRRGRPGWSSRLADGTWRTLPTEEFMGRERPAKLPPEDDRDLTGVNVPPPAPVPPPSVLGEQTESEVTARNRREPRTRIRRRRRRCRAGCGPLLVAVGGPLLAAALADGGRRGGQARTPSPATPYAGRASTRIVGAWRELVDHARDLGQRGAASSVVTTRREQSLRLAARRRPALARRADAHVFGPDAPPVEAAEDFWADVDAERRAMSAVGGPLATPPAAVSLRTLRWGGPPTRRTPRLGVSRPARP